MIPVNRATNFRDSRIFDPMEWLTDVSLKSYNTFGIDARTRHFLEVRTPGELKTALQSAPSQPLLILGGGSNVLFTGDFEGAVIKVDMKGIHLLREDEQHVWIKAMAGEVWHELVLYCLKHDYAGIENLSLIPGLVGAAPMQNIGAYGVELQEVFEELEAMTIGSGALRIFDKAACRFGYRDSVFKNELKGKYVILSVTLRLNKTPELNTSYGAVQETLETMGVLEPTIRDVSEAVCCIRQSKLPDPAEIGNAGSFFKNPELEKTVFDRLQEQCPGIPNYPLPDNKVKVPAAWLIEQCGWKGKRVGETGAHKDQALVLVNYGQAQGDEIKQLSEDIRQSVKKKFGITLHPEVNII